MESAFNLLIESIAHDKATGKDVIRYCSYCTKCQLTKLLPNQPAPLQPTIASRPWELVADWQ